MWTPHRMAVHERVWTDWSPLAAVSLRCCPAVVTVCGCAVALGLQVAVATAFEAGEDVQDAVGRHPHRRRAQHGEPVIGALGMPSCRCDRVLGGEGVGDAVIPWVELWVLCPARGVDPPQVRQCPRCDEPPKAGHFLGLPTTAAPLDAGDLR